jgi:hypothetical protein
VEQRFGDVLERHLQPLARQSRVYSLGIVGANLQGYIQQLQDVPRNRRAKRVIVVFCVNDMPPRSNLQDTLQHMAFNVGRGSVTLRMVVDSVRIWVTPNEEEYNRVMLSHFDETDKTFSARWSQLKSQLGELFQVAEDRSRERPALVLLPGWQAFEGPLRRVGRVAEGVGFQVVETMPAFRDDGRGHDAYRAAPNDPHFNERGNKIIAEVLLRVITDTLRPCERLSANC